MEKQGRLHNMVLSSVALICGFFLVSHFLITFFYLTPLNPVKARIWDPIQVWAKDLFAQNWSLFAPTPIHHDSALLVRFRTSDGRESEWYNISHAMINGLHRQPFGPYVRLVRIHLTGTRYYQGFGTPEQELLRDKVCDKVPDDELCQRQDPATVKLHEMGRTVLQRYASAVAHEYSEQVGLPVTEVQFRILRATVRPFSQKDDPNWEPEVSSMDSEWLPYEDVHPLPVRLLTVKEGKGERHPFLSVPGLVVDPS